MSLWFGVWAPSPRQALFLILGACGAYAWCIHLARRLPLAVYSERLQSVVAQLEARRDVLQSEVQQLVEDKAELAAEIGEARSWLQQNQAKIEQLPAKRAEVELVEDKLRQQRSALEELENAVLEAKNHDWTRRRRFSKLPAHWRRCGGNWSMCRPRRPAFRQM